MGVICIDRNTTAMDELQVAIKYTFNLAVRKVRGKIASIFFQGVHMFKPQYFYSLQKLLAFHILIFFIIE